MWGASTIDGRLVRTVEYDITDFRKSGSNLYADLIDLVVQGPSRLVKPADLPTDFPGGGNALGTNTATDGSTSQTRKHGDVSMTARGRRCSPPPRGTKGGPNADSIMPNLVTRLASLLVDRYNRRQFSQAGRSAKRYVGRHAVLPPQHDCEVDWRDLVLRKKGWTNCEPVTTSDDPLDFTSRDDPRGVLAPVASKILMNIWAFCVRWDLLIVVAKLATMVTK